MTELGCVGVVVDAKKERGRILRVVWVRAIVWENWSQLAKFLSLKIRT